MIVVRVEVLSFWDISANRRLVAISCHQIINKVINSRVESISGCEIFGPQTSISVFSLMDSEIWRPNSVMNNSLSIVPLLEIIAFILLMSWVEFLKENHFINQFSLRESLINHNIILFMNESVTSCANS